MPNKEKQKKALKDWIRAEEQAEKCITSPNSILGNKPVTPFSCPVKVPKKVEEIPNHVIDAQLYAQAMLNPYGDLPPTQQKIHQIMNAMKDLLLYKNQKYGDSAINPKGIFYKGDSTNSILIRLDDKIGRVMSNTEEKPRVNDVCDIIGYCTLLLISMGVTSEDIAKFKD